VINGDELPTPFSSPFKHAFCRDLSQLVLHFYDREIAGPIKISIGVRAAFSGITLPRSGLLARDNFRFARNPQVMARIGSAGITSGLPVNRSESSPSGTELFNFPQADL
jgi:hypothetical protein